MRMRAASGRCEGGRGEDQRAGRGGQGGPVHLAAHVGDGVRGAQRQTGVGRHGAGAGQAGDDLELHVAARDRVDLGDDRVHRQRVTGHQAHHVETGLGLGQQGQPPRPGRRGRAGRRLRPRPPAGRSRRPPRRRPRPAVGGVGPGGSGGRGQVGADDGQHDLRHVGVGEHQRGVREDARARREQARVARTRTDERDASRRPCGPVRFRAQSSSLPLYSASVVGGALYDMTSRAPSSNNSAATASPSSAERPGVYAGRTDHVGSVCRRHACAQRQLVEDVAVLIDGLDHLGDRAHRCGTTRLQFGQQGSLGGDRGAGVGIVQLRQ